MAAPVSFIRWLCAAPPLSRDDHGYAERYLQRREQIQAFMRHLEASMIAIGAIPTEHIDFEALLEGLQIFNLRPHDLPKCFDVPFQQIGFRQVRLKMPSIVAPSGRT